MKTPFRILMDEVLDLPVLYKDKVVGIGSVINHNESNYTIWKDRFPDIVEKDLNVSIEYILAKYDGDSYIAIPNEIVLFDKYKR